jgi:hypothetical protein
VSKQDKIIKVGFCVAYDWALLRRSLPLVYKDADVICLSIDSNRKSWSGSPYSFDAPAFFKFIQEIDVEKKIDVYEDSFYKPEHSPIENDNYQRTLMAARMGKKGWHIQIDSDEYFLDFTAFVQYLRKMNPNPTGQEKPINVNCNSVSIIKSVNTGYLIVDNSKTVWESMPFATNCPVYLNARRNGHFNHTSPFFVIHETWAREESQLKQKLDSWGHTSDFLDKQAYLSFWKSLDETNYSTVQDFHPLQPGDWHALMFVKANGINELINQVRENPIFAVGKFRLLFRNSRNVHRIKKLLSLIFQ